MNCMTRRASLGTLLVVVLGYTYSTAAAPASAPCIADLNSDGAVNGADLGLLLGAWGPGPSIADLNSDGSVNGADLGLLLGAWGPCPTTFDLYERPTQHTPLSVPVTGLQDVDTVDPPAQAFGTSHSDTYLFSGEFYHTAVDLSIRGRGLDFVWARKYRSRLGPDTIMGNGWDHSYNIFIEQQGADLVLHDGNSRCDVYTFDPGRNSWHSSGFYRELTQNPDTSYTLMFSDRSSWHFLPFTGSSQDGKLDIIKDRNNNVQVIEYDSAGRPILIHDTLDSALHNRDIQVVYNPDGLISDIVDFTGRTIHYDYYGTGNPNGNFGDLKSVTSPAVSGTPTNNDYPLGKTYVYTYSTGFSDTRLNHNLLTITDPKGQTYLSNVYSTTLVPTDFEFDHLVTQTHGNPGEIIDYVYVPQVPAPVNNFSDRKTIVNDRVGNVRAHFYNPDPTMRLVEVFTGRANPTLPTTDSSNLPGPSLRATDPPKYTTIYEYNSEFEVTKITTPEGSVSETIYDSLNPEPRSRGNLVTKISNPGPRGATPALLVRSYLYDPITNNDTNQVTQYTDARGSSIAFQYDPSGNCTQIIERDPAVIDTFSYNASGQLISHALPDNAGVIRTDTWNYYTAGASEGYLRQSEQDSTAFTLITEYTRDALGRPVAILDPKLNDTQYTFNTLDQLVLKTSRDVDGVGTRYTSSYFYDPNDNMVRTDTENKNENGLLDPLNNEFTTIHEYDILNYLTRTIQESDSFFVPLVPPQLDSPGLPDADFRTTEYAYDANRNRTLVRLGEAAEGRKPFEIIVTEYDERDLVFKEIRADGAPDQSTTQYDYDGDSNVVRMAQGLEAPLTGGTIRETLTTYDGYNRLVLFADPMGNTTSTTYDANSNVILTRAEGENTDVPGSALNVLLNESTFVYDALDRLFHTETLYFDPVSGLPIGPGISVFDNTWTNSSHIRDATDDNGHITLYEYDSMYRLSRTTDPAGNAVVYLYDSNSNVIDENRTDLSDLGAPSESFQYLYTYDGLDRLTSASDNVGNTTSSGYDSRSNRLVDLDEDLNKTIYVYDGLNRKVRVNRELTDTGTGAGVLIGSITTKTTWDDSDLVTSKEDDNGNITQYTYDNLDRLISQLFSDTTVRTQSYDVHDNRITTTDPNGTSTASLYDLNNRLTGNNFTPGAAVSTNTTFQQFKYDGLGRLVSSLDDDTAVLFSWDSLTNQLSETLNGVPTVRTFDGVGNKLTVTYPSLNKVFYTYNTIDLDSRINLNAPGGPLVAEQSYVGHRIELLTYGNGVTSPRQYNGAMGVIASPGDFGHKQVKRIEYIDAFATPLKDFEYKYDRRQNRTSVVDGNAGVDVTDRSITLDSASRVISDDVLRDLIVTEANNRQYDDVGNRLDVSSNNNTGLYTMDPAVPVFDFQMNQYSESPKALYLHTDNGEVSTKTAKAPTNLGLSQFLYTYDVFSQLVEVLNVATGEKTSFTYDPAGRRTSKVVDKPTFPLVETFFLYDGPKIIEDRNGVGSLLTYYIGGVVSDNLLLASSSGSEIYYHHDVRLNVYFNTDNAGTVIEEWDYEDFGAPRRTLAQLNTDLTGAAASDSQGLFANPPQRIAESFPAQDNGRMRAIRWFGGYAFNPPTLVDEFNIRVYDDAGGVPGIILYEETATSVGSTPTGRTIVANNVPEYAYTYTLNTPLELLAGNNYWVSIEGDGLVSSNVWGWETASPGDGSSQVSVAGGPWAPFGFDMSFEILSDESAIGNVYLFAGMRYDVEIELHDNEVYENGMILDAIVPPGNRYLDPATGRYMTRDPHAWSGLNADGNGYTFNENNGYAMIPQTPRVTIDQANSYLQTIQQMGLHFIWESSLNPESMAQAYQQYCLAFDGLADFIRRIDTSGIDLKVSDPHNQDWCTEPESFPYGPKTGTSFGGTRIEISSPCFSNPTERKYPCSFGYDSDSFRYVIPSGFLPPVSDYGFTLTGDTFSSNFLDPGPPIHYGSNTYFPIYIPPKAPPRTSGGGRAYCIDFTDPNDAVSPFATNPYSDVYIPTVVIPSPTLPSIGTFEVRAPSSRNRQSLNPKTGETIYIPSSKPSSRFRFHRWAWSTPIK
jgi:YD repeat-containing protein